jgi:hypothetical protein
MSDLASLLEKVRSAKGADTMLDHDLEWHFGEWDNLGGWWRRHKVTGEEQRYSYAPVPAYTASIDAALALEERKLPGWACGFDRGQKTAIAFVDPHDFEDRIGGGRYVAKAQTAPLAILVALLTALITQETPNGN